MHLEYDIYECIYAYTYANVTHTYTSICFQTKLVEVFGVLVDYFSYSHLIFFML